MNREYKTNDCLKINIMWWIKKNKFDSNKDELRFEIIGLKLGNSYRRGRNGCGCGHWFQSRSVHQILIALPLVLSECSVATDTGTPFTQLKTHSIDLKPIQVLVDVLSRRVRQRSIPWQYPYVFCIKYITLILIAYWV